MQLTNEDNMALMSRYPDRHFDLAIVDPPYGINAPNMVMGSNPKRNQPGQFGGVSVAQQLKRGRLNHGNGKLKNRRLNTMSCDWDMQPPSAEYFAELFRVSKHQIIWGGNYFALPPCRGFAIWNKVQPWENFSQAEFAWTSFDTPAKVFTYSNRGGANTEKKIHPTQKPVDLYKWLLTKYATPGNTILDTHLGSMSLAIACYDYGFHLTGCEIDPKYFETALDRLKKHQSQRTLF